MSNIEPPLPTLTEKEKEEIWKKAQAKVQAELRERAKRELFEEYERIARQELVPEEQLEPLLIDLAGHSSRITLDGIVYMHGHTYYFTQAQRATVLEIMQRTWTHEAEVGGANSNLYRAPRDNRITMSDLGRSAASILRM